MKPPRRFFLLSIFALLIGTAGAPSQVSGAIITAMSGAIEVVEFPPSLNGGAFISQTHIRLIREGPGVVTAGVPDFTYDGAYHDPSLPVVPGDNTFGNAVTTPYSGPGLPAVGTEVYSVLLHFDPNLSSLPFSLTEGIAQSATIIFDRPIIGVYVTSGSLTVTDVIFSPSGVTFPSGNGRDMEFNYDGDIYAVSPDRYELSLTMYGHNGGALDEMRVILEPVSACTGDLDGSGLMDSGDLHIFADHFGEAGCGGVCVGDIEPAYGDGDFDGLDLGAMADALSAGCLAL